MTNTYVDDGERTTGLRYNGEPEPRTRYAYDDRGQVVATDHPYDVHIQWEYDERGLGVGEITKAGSTERRTRHFHDDRGRLLRTRLLLGDANVKLAYHYDCP